MQKSDEERVVLLFDIHIPFNIPLDPVFEYIKDFKPHKVILGGDAHDFTSVCQWIADQSRNLEGGTVFSNFEQLKTILLIPLRKAVGKDCEIVYLEGNHENWLEQASVMNPNGKGYWGLAKNIPKEIQVIPENIHYKLSEHLYTVHGTYTNDLHAKKAALIYHKTILYSHTHDVQVFTMVSPIDSEILYKGQSCGCLCKRNPSYMRNKPNRWVLGFTEVVLEKKTGFFWDHQIYVINGKFRANGRWYK